MSSYDWNIAVSSRGAFTVTARGLLAGVFRTREEAQEYIQRILNRDLIEHRAREWAAQELIQWAQEWATELGVPLEEALEDIKSGIDEALLDFLAEAE
jgi:hypothetical protein